uniref:Protein FMC1 homolog n=1 Tax=Strongyloides stercoralis TaxID=6248 RepID=A0A0K0ED04_STRER
MNSRIVGNFKKIFKEILPISEKNFLDKEFFLKTMSSYCKDVDSKMILNSSNIEDEINYTYATYLISTKRLSSLQNEYSSGERSIEDSAKLVGLALPKKNEL